MSAEAAEKLATQRTPKPFEDSTMDVYWMVGAGENGYDPCASLSYVVLGINGGTASSPYHVALFHNGEYLGTATSKAYGFFPKVTRLADNKIQVRYRFPVGDECNACATGSATAQFTYSESAGKVIMTGSVPPIP